MSTTINASDVKKLRDITGAGMMDCKKALEESNGDIDKAVEYLRKKGAKVAELRAGREAKEGCIAILSNKENTYTVMLQMACETDFVAKNESFIAFTFEIAQVALDQKIKTIDELLQAKIDGITVQEKINEKVGVIGENISIKSLETLEGNYVGFYNHGHRAGAIVAFDTTDNVQEIGKDIAMQITAMKPVAVDESTVSEETKQSERSIAMDKAKAEGKPAEILEKIADGALKKFYKEFTLLNQEFFKDSSKTIAQVLKEASPNAKITAFRRVELG